MKEMEHFTNGFKTKIWNSLTIPKDSISQKIIEKDNIKWISLVPDSIDENNILRKYRFVEYYMSSDYCDDYVLDVDLFIQICTNLYFDDESSLLNELKHRNIQNHLFDVSWKIDAPL
jgi:hypothetical protein